MGFAWSCAFVAEQAFPVVNEIDFLVRFLIFCKISPQNPLSLSRSSFVFHKNSLACALFAKKHIASKILA